MFSDSHPKHICSSCRPRGSSRGTPLLGLPAHLASTFALEGILDILFKLTNRVESEFHLFSTHLQTERFPFIEKLLRGDRVDAKDGLQLGENIFGKAIWGGRGKELIELSNDLVLHGVGSERCLLVTVLRIINCDGERVNACPRDGRTRPPAVRPTAYREGPCSDPPVHVSLRPSAYPQYGCLPVLLLFCRRSLSGPVDRVEFCAIAESTQGERGRKSSASREPKAILWKIPPQSDRCIERPLYRNSN